MTEIRKITKAFEAYALFSWGIARKPSDKPNAKKHFGRRAEIEDPQGADEAQINAFSPKKPNTKVMKCFNYGGSRYDTKECQKSKNECPECQFLGGSYKKECQRNTTPRSSAQTANSLPSTTLWNNNYDPLHAIRGMDYKQIKVYFFDLKDTHKQSNGEGKGLVN